MKLKPPSKCTLQHETYKKQKHVIIATSVNSQSAVANSNKSISNLKY